jgi:signal transduction histidine kinase
MAISDADQLFRTAARSPRSGVETRLAVAGVLVWIAAVTVTAAGSRADAAFSRALLEALIVGVPIGVGLYALRAPVNVSFGYALLGIGFAWSLTALTASSLSVPFTIGRLATWMIFPCVVYLLLAFPDGRIDKGLDRGILVTVVVVFVVLFYGTAPFVQAFPPKTLWGTCTTACPPNAVFVLDAQPALLTNITYAREWLVEALWIALFVSMYRRWRVASPLQRRAMGPAFVAGVVLGVSHYAHITARQLGVTADTVIQLSSVWTFCIVAVCAGFLGGLVWRRTLLAQSLARLSEALRSGGGRVGMRDAVATAIRDPTVQLLFHHPGAATWRDAWGRAVAEPHQRPPDRAVTTLGRDEVALVHDRALLDDTELLDAVGAMLLAEWRHERLTADLRRAMSELDESRRRIAEAANLERARIERDLHDGAQQRLIALRIRLGLAEDCLRSDPAAGIDAVRQLGFEAEAALDELQAIARGVYPPVLTERGVADALHSMALQAPRPVHVAADGITRQPMEIESAVYFTCVEAVQNALKHADGATGVWIELRQTGDRFRFEVRDDGPGFWTDGADGRGLRNMHDRIEAIGGRLTVESSPAQGTRVSGSLPLT